MNRSLVRSLWGGIWLFLIMLTFPITVSAQTTILTSQLPSASYTDSDYELGMKFTTSEKAAILGIRFYKAAGENGTHTGKIWNASGIQIASAEFVNESASGWQYVKLDEPLSIDPGVTYTVSVNANAVYPATSQGLQSAITNGFLSSAADGNNGVFNDAPGSFPSLSFNNSNYFVDVAAITQNSLFNDPVPPAVSTDGVPYELGVRFTVSQKALLTHIKYYKPAGENFNAHLGNLWNGDGTHIASVNFTPESADEGWKYAALAAPVIVEPGNIYVVSVNANFAYPYESQGLASQITNGILSTAEGINGVFSTAIGIFPNQSYNSTNYFRDVVVLPLDLLAPALYSPANNAQGQPLNIVLTWTANYLADSYTVQVSDKADFSNLIVNESGITSLSYALSGLQFEKTYYWRVRSDFSGGSSEFSDAYSFKTVKQYLPVLTYPIDDMKLYSAPPLLTWYIDGGLSTGLKYDLYYSLNPDMSSAAVITDITGLSYSLTGLLPGTKYYWQIVSKTSDGVISAYSAIESFITFGEALIPIASWPSGNNFVYTYSPTLYWYVSGSSTGLTYEVEIVEGAAAFTGTPTYTGITGLSLQLAGLLQDKTYKWRVRSNSAGNYSDWSEPAIFRTLPGAEIVVPVANWPSGGTLVYTNPPSVYWYITGASTGLTFEVRYAKESEEFPASPQFTGLTSFNVQLPVLEPNVLYKWQVRAYNGTGYSDWSNSATFKVYQPVITAVVPVPSWPVGNATVYALSVQLNWYIGTADPGYTYEVDFGTVLDGTADITDITTLYTTVTSLTAGTKYYWSVRTKYGAEYSAWSAPESFTTIDAPVYAVTPQLSWPVGGAVVYSTNQTLFWYTGTYSAGLKYTLMYSNNASFSPAVTITDISQSYYALTGLTPGATYYWKVLSYDGTVTSAYSTAGIFTVVEDGWPVIPLAASPSNGVQIEDNTPVLSWYMPASFSAEGYELQISKDKNFSEAVSIKTESSNYAVEGLQTGNSYYWRVRSAGSKGSMSGYSPAASFNFNAVTEVKAENTPPESYQLSQNYPNPFNPVTNIKIGIPAEGKYSLTVYNLLGQEVTTLFSGRLTPGHYNFIFNAAQLPSGVYFYRLSGSNVNISKSMLLLK